MKLRNAIFFTVVTSLFFSFHAHSAEFARTPTQKEWTFLVYMSGNNDLAKYGAKDIIEMERVGSSADVNIVVQWANKRSAYTKRLLVEKSKNPSKVTSPILERLAPVDMGDYNNLVEFIRWGVQKYPAKRYFVDIWGHGHGWHLQSKAGRLDISPDDRSGNIITTLELGNALRKISAEIGRKIDIVGTDACLMSSVEVVTELRDSTEIFIGSEEGIPAEGWPYDLILNELVQNPFISKEDFSRALINRFMASYEGHEDPITLTAVYPGLLMPLLSAITRFSNEHAALSQPLEIDQARRAAANTEKYYSESDYRDLGDYLTELERLPAPFFRADVIRDLRAGISNAVLFHRADRHHPKSAGLTVWLPQNQRDLKRYQDRYTGLDFYKITRWSDAWANILERP